MKQAKLTIKSRRSSDTFIGLSYQDYQHSLDKEYWYIYPSGFKVKLPVITDKFFIAGAAHVMVRGKYKGLYNL